MQKQNLSCEALLQQAFDPVHRRLFVARGNGVFKLDVDTGLMDPRVVPGSEGRAVTVLPEGDQVLTTVAGYSAAILFAAQDGKVSKMFKLRQAGTPWSGSL